MVVDVQNDFCPGGALAVKNGDSVVKPLNKVIDLFNSGGLSVFFTRDWHPEDHISFKARGGKWPPHCVQWTHGAEFHPSLHVPISARIVSKGDSPDKEAYSGFQGTDLGLQLKALGVDEVVVGGLATDYCVKETCLDAMRGGFKVILLEDCVRPVNVKETDGDAALMVIKGAGAKFTTSDRVHAQMASTQQ